MSLIVEDGTGKANAESYLSVEAFRAYCTANGYDLGDDTDSACEINLRQAFRYINTIGRYKGVKLVATQRGQFPRTGCVDWSGNAATGIFPDLVEANAELAWKARSEELYVDLDRGGRIASETTGPISTSYFADAPAGKTFRAAMQLLAQYMRDPRQAYPPFIGGAAGQENTTEAPTELTPIFDVGMHANNRNV